MSLSMHGETLFHFTETIDTLFKIIESRQFKASLAMERLVYKARTGGTEATPYLWVPMVSFCDYKLYEIGHHALNYGYYGLGMSKKWGINNKLNPVLYVSEKSEIGSELRSTLDNIAKEVQDENMQISSVIRHANLFSWTKNYQGTLRRKGTLRNDNFRFADDKEWRYVAEITYRSISEFHVFEGARFISVPNIICQCLNNKKIQECQDCYHLLDKIKKAQNHLILDGDLKFNANDINFILLKKNDDRDLLLNWIKNQNIDMSDMLLLASKIVVIDELDLRKMVPLSCPYSGECQFLNLEHSRGGG